MGRKQSRVFVIFPLLALAGAAAILAVSCSKGSGVDSGGAVALSSLTPIANCIVDSNDDVEVGGPKALPGCDNVILEPSAANPVAFGTIDIANGGNLKLASAPSKPNIPVPPLEVGQFCVANGGRLYAGSATSPVPAAAQYTIIFVGDKATSGSPYAVCKDSGPNQDQPFKKGIDVQAGGSLDLYGGKGVPQYDANGKNIGGISWTTLAKPAGPMTAGAAATSSGPTTLYLSANVEQTTDFGAKKGEPWQSGDWIVVATTDYDPFHSEFVQIDTVAPGGPNGAGSTITLKQPLQYYHFGSLPPSSNAVSSSCPNPFYAPPKVTAQYQPAFLCDGADRNYGVDERAEVGLISRGITLTSETPTGDIHWGGEIKIHKGFKSVVLQGVRISKFGKDQIGSYPIHFHRVGDAGNRPIVNADSVDHSYNKCVTIHSTSNLTISNLVCARIVGHIFYEELNSATADNEAGLSGLVFNHDLGIGAMSNSFDIYAYGSQTRQDLINKYWWKGDYMTNDQCANQKPASTCINYDGFNIPDTDNQLQSAHGHCYDNVNNLGVFYGGVPLPCSGAGKYYIEPASGFWIQNPGTTLTNDAIAGCQGAGVGYWWALPNGVIRVNSTTANVDLRLNPLGTVKDDRSSACYHAYFAEGEGPVVSGAYSPIKNLKNPGTPSAAYNDGPNIIARFEGLTATHDRWRALWLRGAAGWFVVKDGHFADDNRGATLLTSGGIEGNAPGIWQLLEDSVMVGESRDNVGRWGPCPQFNPLGANTGWKYGCIDYSRPKNVNDAHSGEVLTQGYPHPYQNSYGYQVYDGPALTYHDRFVNYNYNTDPNSATTCNDPTTTPNPSTTTCAFSALLDHADRRALADWQKNNTTVEHYKHYEGDAAFGWFPANQSAYPTASATRQLMWKNTNFRHQIFTEHVKISGTFGDSDKNTALIDEDGSLSGFKVKLGSNSGGQTVHPISLNNLPFNSVSNAVDECYSRGTQDQVIQGRDSSLMSPVTVGTLEFGSLYPWRPGTGTQPRDWPGDPVAHWQRMTFTRTDLISEAPPPSTAKYHPSMTLNGRAGRGYWEPKVSNGYGYYVTTAPPVSVNGFPPADQIIPNEAGIWKWIDVGMTDIVDPNISTAHPFYIRLGIDYASYKATSGGGIIISKPTNNFVIKRGYKTYKGGTFNGDPTFSNGTNNDLLEAWTNWPNCSNLDGFRVGDSIPNIPYGKGPGCPAGEGSGLPAVMTLDRVDSYAELTDPVTGGPAINKYFYDASTGYLWLNIVQEEPNAPKPSPIGSCDINYGPVDPACPITHGESYYACPKNGCIIYTIEMKDPNYVEGPAPTTALPPKVTHLPGAPAQENKLEVVYGANPGTIVVPVPATDKQNVVYYQASTATEPACTPTQHDGG